MCKLSIRNSHIFASTQSRSKHGCQLMFATKLVASGNHVEEERLTGTEMVWEAQIAVGAALGFCDHLKDGTLTGMRNNMLHTSLVQYA